MATRVSPNGQVERIRQTVHSMQRRLRNVDVLLEEQMRTVELESDAFRPQGIVIGKTMRKTLQLCLVIGSLLAFTLGYFAGKAV